jgi:hypothetical protein
LDSLSCEENDETAGQFMDGFKKGGRGNGASENRCSGYRNGRGEFRGGPGTLVEFVAYTEPGVPSFLMTGNSDGTRFAPPGVAGGWDAPLLEII